MSGRALKRGSYLMAGMDWLAGVLSWLLFFIYRKSVEVSGITLSESISDQRLYLGLVVIPIVWMVLWWILGSYDGVYRKSRLQTIYMTGSGCLIGSLGLLFTVIRDDLTLTISTYMHSFLMVLLIHWLCYIIFRLCYLSFTKWQLSSGRVRFSGTIITDNEFSQSQGLSFTDIIKKIDTDGLRDELSNGRTDSLILHVKDKVLINEITPLIIGKAAHRGVFINETDFGLIDYDYHASPSLRDSYMALKTAPIWAWQKHLKRMIDVVVVFSLAVMLSPLMLWLAYRVKRSSAGPVLFRQERIGRHGLSFMIYKFRSMYEDSEDSGPALATHDDQRCTPFGKWMRRWRLDELPQFYNVLKGDMSLVGPRPERRHYADQLRELNPRYALLWQVKPGVTSWGQIKYGYASTVDEMLKRFRYDLLYMENMSILLDFRILYYTLIVLWQGRGR